MHKGGIRGAWFETRLHWEVISTHHLPVVGCTRQRKLLFRSFVSKYVSRNLSRKIFATLWVMFMKMMFAIFSQNHNTIMFLAMQTDFWNKFGYHHLNIFIFLFFERSNFLVVAIMEEILLEVSTMDETFSIIDYCLLYWISDTLYKLCAP